jgi:hypothetical protein
MKNLLVILFIFFSNIVYSQIDYNIYLNLKKSEIVELFKIDNFKYSFETKTQSDLDSTGKLVKSKTNYTYLVYYGDNRGYFVFNKMDKCVKYYILCANLENYWLYYDYYNQIMDRDRTREDLTWIEKSHKYYSLISIKALNPNQFYIFSRLETYK